MVLSGIGPVLVTGANGFVGSAVCRSLRNASVRVTATVRHVSVDEEPAHDGSRVLATGPIESARWPDLVRGHRTVVHLAAHVHKPGESLGVAAERHRRVNLEATLALAKAAADAGVERFVFASTIKVCGETSAAGSFDGRCTARPSDAYAASKWEAEVALRALACTSTMALVVIRPPLVYGPGVRANFLRLMQLVARGVPLPLASVSNRRSLVYVDNLADFVARCIWHPGAAGRAFAIADEPAMSTPELVQALARALQVEPRLFRFPPNLLKGAAWLAGRHDTASRLLESLVVDPADACSALDWQPPVTQATGLAETANWYRMRAGRDWGLRQ
jgi:nucleoside-diphosphate-sugar epimerase